MKRTITITLMALLLCVCMVFGLTACGGDNNNSYDQITAEQAKAIMDSI